MIQLEVTNKEQGYVSALLLRIEMSQGEDETPTYTVQTA
jgi:hypothetical protein